MKSLRLRLELGAATTHPMHEFVCRRDDFTRTRLLHWNPDVERTTSMIFHVEGDDSEAYDAALDDVAAVEEYRLSVRDGGSFYVYVREEQAAADARLMSVFSGGNLVVVPPVEYRSDRSMVFSLVGTTEAVQSAVGETPDEVGVDVLRVADYDAGAVDPMLQITPRQREAVTAAVDVGYYGATRDGSVADVAEALDCSTATAAEHLRKAEAEIVSRAVERRL
ncbi:Predicted DNA binding protein, contains HTH domain [Halogranum amylolyticum]|uniref:Predicted DNA binding protein, contains HTH domain n=1 Tax=Halogranum amylolyticum TaxID=660520 RepID=A0A1H8NAX8_9EURY|nr:helix-turn-helix domain-containing protein [Halogranum amylolyticum]SEO26583.1 Predicted DNA binding protein, contains HTH domain [Halogranum amylolyticum]